MSPIVSGGGGSLPSWETANTAAQSITYAPSKAGDVYGVRVVPPDDAGTGGTMVLFDAKNPANENWLLYRAFRGLSDTGFEYFFVDDTSIRLQNPSAYSQMGAGNVSIRDVTGGVTVVSIDVNLARFLKGVQTGQQTSGALPTVALVSGTGAQIDTVSDRETVTPVTFNPGAATTATCTAALSPDNVTYSTLGVETEPVGTILDGTIHLVKIRVPATWYLKLTVNAQATLGTTTYY